MSAYFVRQLDAAEINAWSALVSRSVSEIIFCQPRYFQHDSDSKVFGVFTNGNLVGGLAAPVVEQQGELGIARRSYLCPYYLPQIFTDTTSLVRRERLRRLVVQALLDHLQERFKFFVLPIHPLLDDLTPFIRSDFQFELRYTYELDLEAPFWEQVDPSVRNHIRCCADVEIIDDRSSQFDFDAALHYEEDHARQGWKSLVQQACQAGYGWSRVAVHGGKPVGGQFIAFDKHRAYNLLSYFDRDIKVRGIASKLIWDAVQRAQAMGLRYLDLEGSVLPDIEAFYQSFGGLRRTYFQVHWHANPAKRQAISYDYT